MTYKELAKEHLEDIENEIKRLRQELILESNDMADRMEILSKKALNSTLNSLGEMQGNGLRIDRLCIRISELEKQYEQFASMVQRVKE